MSAHHGAIISHFGYFAEMDNLIGSLKDAGLCKDVHYKELYIPQAELEGNVKPVLSSAMQVHFAHVCMHSCHEILVHVLCRPPPTSLMSTAAWSDGFALLLVLVLMSIHETCRAELLLILSSGVQSPEWHTQVVLCTGRCISHWYRSSFQFGGHSHMRLPQ